MRKNTAMFRQCPQTPAPGRKPGFLMQAVLETPKLMNDFQQYVPQTAQSPQTTSSMQLFMFNQVTTDVPAATPVVNLPHLHNFPQASPEAQQRSNFRSNESNTAGNKRKYCPPNESPQSGGKFRKPSPSLKALPAPPSQLASGGTPSAAEKQNPKRLRLITGTIEHIFKLTKESTQSTYLVEIVANVLTVKEGKHKCERILLLRNRKGPVLQAVFYEIDFQLPPIAPGDLVRCVGRLQGGSRLQILKIGTVNDRYEQAVARLQTVSGFVVSKVKG